MHSCFLWDWFVPLLPADAESKDGLAQIRMSPGAGAVVTDRNSKSQHDFWTKIWPSEEAFLKESTLWNKGVGYSSLISPYSLKTYLDFRLIRLRSRWEMGTLRASVTHILFTAKFKPRSLCKSLLIFLNVTLPLVKQIPAGICLLPFKRN